MTTTFSTHVHYIPTEDVSFAKEYAPLRYVGARQWFLDLVSDRLREVPSAPPSEYNTPVSNEMWDVAELVANAIKAPDLYNLVQIVHENNYVSIFLYHPEEELIEEMYVSLDALMVYDFAAAAAAGTWVDTLMAAGKFGGVVLVASVWGLSFSYVKLRGSALVQSWMRLAIKALIAPGVPLSFLPAFVKRQGTRFGLLSGASQPNNSLIVWQPSTTDGYKYAGRKYSK